MKTEILARDLTSEIDKSFKYPYNIDDEKSPEFIQKMCGQHGDKIKSIETGRAGLEMLKKAKSDLVDMVVVGENFDPLHADAVINPLVYGYRLSSYMFYVKVEGDMLFKFIPRNKYI